MVRRLQEQARAPLRQEGGRVPRPGRPDPVPRRAVARPAEPPVRPRRPGRLGLRPLRGLHRPRGDPLQAPARDRADAPRGRPPPVPRRQARRGAGRASRQRRSSQTAPGTPVDAPTPASPRLAAWAHEDLAAEFTAEELRRSARLAPGGAGRRPRRPAPARDARDGEGPPPPDPRPELDGAPPDDGPPPEFGRAPGLRPGRPQGRVQARGDEDLRGDVVGRVRQGDRPGLPDGAARPRLPVLPRVALAARPGQGDPPGPRARAGAGCGAAAGGGIRARRKRPSPPASSPPRRKKEPVRNLGKKVGRNDPCPCGSGKKFKACCMRKEAGSAASESRGSAGHGRSSPIASTAPPNHSEGLSRSPIYPRRAVTSSSSRRPSGRDEFGHVIAWSVLAGSVTSGQGTMHCVAPPRPLGERGRACSTGR